MCGSCGNTRRALATAFIAPRQETQLETRGALETERRTEGVIHRRYLEALAELARELGHRASRAKAFSMPCQALLLRGVAGEFAIQIAKPTIHFVPGVREPLDVHRWPISNFWAWK